VIKTEDNPNGPALHSVTVTGDADGNIITTYNPPRIVPDSFPMSPARPMVTRAVRQQRRAKNKAGRVSRRINRKRGA
jgi:hypothetical protein